MHSNITVTKMPLVHCPACNEKLDAATSVDGQGEPTVGDVSICATCGEILEYNEEMQVVRIKDSTVDDLDAETVSLLSSLQTRIREKLHTLH